MWCLRFYNVPIPPSCHKLYQDQIFERKNSASYDTFCLFFLQKGVPFFVIFLLRNEDYKPFELWQIIVLSSLENAKQPIVLTAFNCRGGSRIPRRRGRQPSMEKRQHANFPKNCMKLRKFWSLGGRPRSATELLSILMERSRYIEIQKIVSIQWDHTSSHSSNVHFVWENETYGSFSQMFYWIQQIQWHKFLSLQ